jgi:hypothetical protein
METHVDLIGVAGLVVGLIALGFAIFGIRDVRKLMRDLILLERNRTWAKVLHNTVYRVVDPTEETAQFQSSADMHEFTMLVRALQEMSMDDAQAYANNEVLSLAREMVNQGIAKWKPHIDEKTVEAHVQGWQSDKNVAVLKNMFGERHTSLKGDTREKMVKY